MILVFLLASKLKSPYKCFWSSFFHVFSHIRRGEFKNSYSFCDTENFSLEKQSTFAFVEQTHNKTNGFSTFWSEHIEKPMDFP